MYNDAKHKVFISYHHKNDENYKKDFEKDFGNLFINESVQNGEYDSELSDGYVKRLIREGSFLIRDSFISSPIVMPPRRK